MSLNITFSQIAAVDPSARFNQDFIIDRVCIDTRKLSLGDTYIAIKGQRFDGHDFIQNAIEAGAHAIITNQVVNSDIVQLVVQNTRQVLGTIARLYRDQLSAIVFGITGSNGKTTVKNLLRSVCRSQGQVTATSANHNNQIGVPLTLLSAKRDDQYVVVEMGTSQVGEIKPLALMVNPDIATITNISESHLNGLGSREQVLTEKADLIRQASPQATIIINQDDDNAQRLKAIAGLRPVITYGIDQAADISACVHHQQVQLKSPIGPFSYQLAIPGRHNVLNSLTAVAMAIAADIDQQSICQGMESYQGENGRLQFNRLGKDVLLIDDTYNANPASSAAALDVLAQQSGRKLFIYAGMNDLGGQTKYWHQQIGQKANEIGVDLLYSYGEQAQPVYEIFTGEKYLFHDLTELALHLLEQIISGDTLLIKGSRCYQMEQVSQYLLEQLS